MTVRTYGTSGPWVVVVHGGPGAAGYMAPVARGLADRFRVLEPFQRPSGGEPLTVARHVQDLHELIVDRCEDQLAAGQPPAIVGSSWGAMLTLAYAAEYPAAAGPLVLIGCGTFDTVARARFLELITDRMDDEARQLLDGLADEVPDEDERMRAMDRLITPLYSHDLVAPVSGARDYDCQAYQETWDDMIRLQDEGVYPAAFAAISSPVLMLHGAVDPHPGGMIRDSLAPLLPQLEYREWERCGHYPWLEREVRIEFFAALREWLSPPSCVLSR